MNTSSFAAVELAIVKLLRAEVPPGVQVTTRSPAQAGEWKVKPGQPGRINVALIRVELNSSPRNLPNPPASSAPMPPPAAFDLSYLISAQAGAEATVEGGVPHLLECAGRALLRQPVLGLLMTDAAGMTMETPVALLVQELSWEQWIGLWRALQTKMQPAVICLARPVPLEF